MGLSIRKLDKNLAEERQNSDDHDFRTRIGSTASSTTTKTRLGRNRASTRLSLRVASLRQSITGYRRVKSSTLHDQRYRSDLYARSSGNPRYKPRKNRFSKKRRVKTQELSIKSDDSDFLELEARKLKSLSLDLERHRSRPTPPSEPKIKPRYYTFCETHPFGSNQSKFDIRSEAFSALSMSRKELKAAAVEMILCVINEDVILPKKLFKAKKSRSGRLLSAFSSKPSSKHKSQKSQITTLRGRLTGGKDFRETSEDEGFEETAYESGLRVPTCLSSELKRAVIDFVDDVEKRYTRTRYHSFKHAVDVTQMMFMLIFFLNSNLSRIQPFTMIVSCLCHDMGHFGANNNFLRSTNWSNNRFLDRFGNVSPLEKFHVFLTKKVMEKSKLFSPDFMPVEVYQEVLQFSERLILNTDMDRHTECMQSAEKDVETEKDLVRNGATEKVPIPESFLVLAIKLCDVANVAREFEDAKQWTDLLSREFKALGTIRNQEKFLARNTDVTIADYDESLEKGNFVISDELSADTLIKYQYHCEDPDFTECSKLTQGFMKTITQPMARLLSEVQAQAGWFLISRMHQNEQSWEAAIDKAENPEASPVQQTQLST